MLKHARTLLGFPDSVNNKKRRACAIKTHGGMNSVTRNEMEWSYLLKESAEGICIGGSRAPRLCELQVNSNGIISSPK